MHLPRKSYSIWQAILLLLLWPPAGEAQVQSSLLEDALRQELHTRLGGKTVVIVAQRISTVLHADRIVVLDDGRIVGQGTHEELMETCEEYREIAMSQLSEAELNGGDAA